MLGLIKERYCKLPTTLLNSVTLSNIGVSNLDSLFEADIDEAIELAPSMLVFFLGYPQYISSEILGSHHANNQVLSIGNMTSTLNQ